MMFTDRYLLAQIDPFLPAGAMSGGMTAFLLWIFGLGLLSFTTPLVSHLLGAGNPAHARKAVSQGILVAVLLSIPVLVFGQKLGRQYFTLLRVPNTELMTADQYLSILILCTPLVFIKAVFSGFYAGIGKPKTVMLVNITGTLINIPLAYLLIHGKLGTEWSGVRGAALGTCLAVVIMTLIYLFLFIRSELQRGAQTFKLDLKLLKPLFFYGSVVGSEFFFLTLAFTTFVTLFHSLGVEATLAITVTLNWSWLLIMPFFGLNIGLMSLVGRAMGKKDVALAEKLTKSGLGIAYSIVVSSSLAFLFFTDSLIQVFGIPAGSPGYDLATSMIRTLPLFCAFDAVCYVLSATLRSTGDGRYCFLVGAFGQWGFILICLYGTYYGGFSPFPIWCLFVGSLFLQASAFLYRYLHGPWRVLSVLDSSYSQEATGTA